MFFLSREKFPTKFSNDFFVRKCSKQQIFSALLEICLFLKFPWVEEQKTCSIFSEILDKAYSEDVKLSRSFLNPFQHCSLTMSLRFYVCKTFTFVLLIFAEYNAKQNVLILQGKCNLLGENQQIILCLNLKKNVVSETCNGSFKIITLKASKRV